MTASRRINATIADVADHLTRAPCYEGPLDTQDSVLMGSASNHENHRIYGISFASVYPLYLRKVEAKGRTQAELDQVICWLTGYTQSGLDSQLKLATTFEQFFAQAPKLNPARTLITGVVCGVRVEAIEHPLMQKIRYLDKLVDELAKGKAMAKVLRA